MVAVKRFSEVLEAADRLSEEEQETLLDVLRHRLAERRREEIAEEVRAARREHAEGETVEATPDELMDQILA